MLNNSLDMLFEEHYNQLDGDELMQATNSKIEKLCMDIMHIKLLYDDRQNYTDKLTNKKNNGMIELAYYHQITKMSNNDLKTLMYQKHDILLDEFTKIINNNSYAKLIIDLISIIYFKKITYINYQLHQMSFKSYKPMYNCIQSYQLRKRIILLALVCSNIKHSYQSNLMKNAEHISSAILIYYQFIFIQKEMMQYISEKYNTLIINNKNNYENCHVIKRSIISLIEESIKNDPQTVEELSKEIKNTGYDDIYNNDIIVNYICEIMSKIFPNYKNVKSNTYNEARSIAHVYQILSIMPKKSEKIAYKIKQIERQFRKGHAIYSNDKNIQENFHDPMLEINKNKDSINHLFHKIVFQGICYKSHKKTENKVNKILLSIYQKMGEYKQLLDKLDKKNNNSIRQNNILNQTMIIFNKYNIDLYKIRPLYTDKARSLKNKYKIPRRPSFIGYFTMIYQLIKESLKITMDNTVCYHQKTIIYSEKPDKIIDIDLYKNMTKFYDDKINSNNIDLPPIKI